jgi:hypothetical protein
MHLGRILLVLMILPCLLLPAISEVMAQARGTIEFSDEAPPPTEQEVQTAKSYEARAVYLANSVQRLGTVMAANQSLIAALDAPVGTDGSDLTSFVGTWRTSLTTLLPEGEPAAVGDDEIGNFVKQTIVLAGKIKSASAAARPGDLRAQAAGALEKQSLIVDQMLAEHGVLNRALRYYPVSAIAHQAPLGCDQIAVFSRDFRCYPKSANPGLPAGQWCDVTDHAQTYSVAEWSSGTIMVVRMESFADHTLGGGLTGQLKIDAHSAASLKPRC